MRVQDFITEKYARLRSPASALKALALLLALAVSAAGQVTTTPATEETRRLDFLVGEWKGKGWMFDARGGRTSEMSQSVKVEREAGRPALRVKDRRTLRLPGVVFGGSPSYSSAPNDATVYYDAAAGLFRWRRDKDRENPSELRIIAPRTVQWEHRSRMGAVRVTIRVTDEGGWHETMEFWSNRQGWQKAFEAVLERVK